MHRFWEEYISPFIMRGFLLEAVLVSMFSFVIRTL